MFGFRPDGRRIRGVDPILRLTPYIMPRRSDAQVFTTQYIDADVLTHYIQEKRQSGEKVSHMAVIVAAWLRTVCEMPMLNRFVIGSQIYARNELTLSFVTIKGRGDKVREAVCKLHFDPSETVFEVAHKIDSAVQKCRDSTTNSIVNRLANVLLCVPAVTGLLVGILKLLDRFGLMPKAIIDASPFHTSMFISNMASLKMNSIYHHIYDFGTTSVFFGMGRTEQRIVSDHGGSITTKKVFPVGCVVDERIMGGAQYGAAFSILSHYLRHPELLEERPAQLRTDGVELALAAKYADPA